MSSSRKKFVPKWLQTYMPTSIKESPYYIEDRVKIKSSHQGDQICRNFAQLVMQHYTETRNVAWYAEKLNISHAHLCTTVKQITGKTCGDIISSMVIMDAKSQLKSISAVCSGHRRRTEFCQYVFFRKILQTVCGDEPVRVSQ